VVITPVNYNLLAVNAFMAVTGLYQLYRKAKYEALGYQTLVTFGEQTRLL